MKVKKALLIYRDFPPHTIGLSSNKSPPVLPVVSVSKKEMISKYFFKLDTLDNRGRGLSAAI